jgi:hypothetical protein
MLFSLWIQKPKHTQFWWQLTRPKTGISDEKALEKIGCVCEKIVKRASKSLESKKPAVCRPSDTERGNTS